MNTETLELAYLAGYNNDPAVTVEHLREWSTACRDAYARGRRDAIATQGEGE